MMIFEAILGFLGLGVQPPTPTFGNIIADARKYLINAWWIATMPGIFLVITLVTLNFIGSTLEKSKNKTLNFSNIFLGPEKKLINKKYQKFILAYMVHY